MGNQVITILAAGSRGDVQPYVALGKGLQAAGMHVRLATASSFKPLVKQYGLEFHQLADLDVESIMQKDEVKTILESRNPVKMLRGLANQFRPVFTEALEGMLAALDGADAGIISSLAQFGGYDACEKLGVTPILTYLQPAVPTSEFPSPFFPPIPNVPGQAIYNRMTHHLLNGLLWQMFRPFVNGARVNRLDLTKLPMSGVWGAIKERELPIMMGCSPHIIPPAKDWPENIHVPGYWFLDEPEEWLPPSDLAAFLADGEPPIYIGFGSMTNRDPEKNTQIMIDALVQSGERGLLLTGAGGLQNAVLPENIFRIESCPHSWLFQRVKAIVHHGGAGTTAAAFRAGKPQIVVPFFADQPFWGRLTEQFGVGVKPLPNKTISAELLAPAIRQVANSHEMERNAIKLGQIIRAEDGVGKAVEIIKSILAS